MSNIEPRPLTAERRVEIELSIPLVTRHLVPEGRSYGTQMVFDLLAALTHAEQRIKELEGECIAAERRAHALNEQIEPLIAERTQRIREERDDLRAENERLRTTPGGVP